MNRSILLALAAAVLVAAALVLSRGDRTASGTGSSIFGDGSDGAATFSTSQTFNPPADAVVDSGTMGGTSLSLSAVFGNFDSGDKILIHQTRGGTAASGQANWELNQVQSYALGTLTVAGPLAHSYASAGADAAQVLVLPEYTDVSVETGATLNAKDWNGSKGGILAFAANGTVTISGTIAANGNDGANGNVNSSSQIPGGAGAGFRGGRAFGNDSTGTVTTSEQGESQLSLATLSTSANGMGGGGATGTATGHYAAGGGGGHSSSGTNGVPGTGSSVGGTGGGTGGSADLITMLFGGAGGGGAIAGGGSAGSGAAGGGAILIIANNISASGGLIRANGGNGGSGGNVASGGGGAGGALLIRAFSATFGTGMLRATGGLGGGNQDGGAGGAGRIRVEYCESISGGNTDPGASVVQITCKPPPSQLNISKRSVIAPPKSCYNVKTSSQVQLFQVCDEDWVGAPEADAVCAGDGICEDEDPDQGEIGVSLVAGDYRVQESVAPPNHAIDPGKYTCDVSTSGSSCALPFTNTPTVRPWHPWDLTGGPGGAPDGVVRVADILAVVQHYFDDKPLSP